MPKMIVIPFITGSGILVSMYSLLGSGFTPFLDIISPKSVILVHMKCNLIKLVSGFFSSLSALLI